MFEALDYYDQTLVRLAQRELWREAAERRLAKQARSRPCGVLRRLTGRDEPPNESLARAA